MKAVLAASVRLGAATADSAGSHTSRAECAISRLDVAFLRRKGPLYHINEITWSILLYQFMKYWEYIIDISRVVDVCSRSTDAGVASGFRYRFAFRSECIVVPLWLW